MAETPAPVTIDPALFKPMIAETVKSVIADAQAESMRAAEAAMAQTRANEATRAQQAARESQPLRKVILDEIGPDLANMALESKSAVDFARFYSANTRAAKHQQAIEDKFQQLVAAGRPTDRDTIYKWYQGEHFDMFVKEREAEQAESQARAAQGLPPMGLGTGTRGGTVIDPWAMVPEDLEKALADKEF
jgi:hypothetical protein